MSHQKISKKKPSRAAKAKPFFNTKALLHMYCAIFYSHIQDGITSWSSTYKTYLNQLSTLQIKVANIIGGGRYYDRATPIYSKQAFLDWSIFSRLKRHYLFSKIIENLFCAIH